MTGDPSGSRIQKTLTAGEIKQLAEWFRESHEAGWRPHVHAPARIEALNAKLNHIYGRTSDGRKWPRI